MRLGLQPIDIERLLADTAYRPLRRLGGGRTGEVHLVEHRFLGRQFALKVLRSHLLADPQFSNRMRREAKAAASIAHPNVVEMVDLWVSAEGDPCVVMELLQGRTLSEELAERGWLPVDEAVELARQALFGLGAAHALGVVHRDVTPDNLFLQQVPGFARTVKVLDFGLARMLPHAARTTFDTERIVPTQTGAIVGSPRFMSPEASRGEPVDSRADLFSLGIVMYVMLTGHGPYDMTTGAAPPSRYAADHVGLELDALVLRAIEENPDARFQSADDFLEALNRLPTRVARR